MKTVLTLSFTAVLCLCAFSSGKIVVNNDEWTLSDNGYAFAADADRFARNVAHWFTNNQPGSFLAYTNNFGLTGVQLAGSMAADGHSWTVSVANPLTLGMMQSYDALFLGGFYTNFSVSDLIQYVQGGGNVYLALGTGAGGAVFEATFWNGFLNAFGLDLVPSYNGISGNIPTASPHPIFAGVSALYQNNGNSIIDLQPANPDNEVLVSWNNNGLYAVYVPEPASMMILGTGLLGLFSRRRNKPSV